MALTRDDLEKPKKRAPPPSRIRQNQQCLAKFLQKAEPETPSEVHEEISCWVAEASVFESPESFAWAQLCERLLYKKKRTDVRETDTSFKDTTPPLLQSSDTIYKGNYANKDREGDTSNGNMEPEIILIPVISWWSGAKDNEREDTVTALQHISNHITDGLNKNKPVDRTVLVPIDLSKAFDTVNNEILLNDILASPLNHHLKRFLSSYLRG